MAVTFEPLEIESWNFVCDICHLIRNYEDFIGRGQWLRNVVRGVLWPTVEPIEIENWNLVSCIFDLIRNYEDAIGRGQC